MRYEDAEFGLPRSLSWRSRAHAVVHFIVGRAALRNGSTIRCGAFDRSGQVGQGRLGIATDGEVGRHETPDILMVGFARQIEHGDGDELDLGLVTRTIFLVGIVT